MKQYLIFSTAKTGFIHAIVIALLSGVSIQADLIGNVPSDRVNGSDGSEGVFYTSYVPIPGPGLVDALHLFYKGDNRTFELIQLRPTGVTDQFSVAYRSGTMTPSGTSGTVSELPLPGGPIPVEAGDLFAHFGRGVPYTQTTFSQNGNQAPNFVPIFFNLGAAGASIPTVGDGNTITINPTGGSSTLGAFPIRADLNRDYAYAVNFTAIPEPSSAMLLVAGALLLHRRMRKSEGLRT